MNIEEPPSEDATGLAPGGPGEAAREWLADIVLRHDVRAAWRGMDPDYRLALTQAVIFLNDQNPVLAGHDREELARQLSSEDPHHPLWSSFADLLVDEFLHDLGEIDLESWGVGAPKPISSGYELVLLVHAGHPATELPEMGPQGVLMHLRGNRWMAAGLSERPAVPGWPPDLGY